MNFPRIALAAISAWIVSLAVGFFMNDFLLSDLLAANQSAMRSEAELTVRLPVGLAFLLIGFFAFAYAFAKGYEGTDGVTEGVRFGVLVGLVVLGFANVWQWVVYPVTSGVLFAAVISSIVQMALYGAIVGWIYRPAGTAMGKAATT